MKIPSCVVFLKKILSELNGLMDITDRPSALMELAIRKEDTGQRVKLQCKSSSSYMFLYLYINMLGGNYDGAYCIDPYD